MSGRRIGLVLLAAVVTMIVLLLAPPGRMRKMLYRNRRPTRLGKAVNATYSWAASSGLMPERWPGKPIIGSTTLETRGRASGLPRSNMVTWVEYEGDRYLVSMLGERTSWVRNARAAGGEAILRRGRRRPVRLEEVPATERAPIIRAWYKRTVQSTRSHIGLDPHAPIQEFEHIAEQHPVFRIVPID